MGKHRASKAPARRPASELASPAEQARRARGELEERLGRPLTDTEEEEARSAATWTPARFDRAAAQLLDALHEMMRAPAATWQGEWARSFVPALLAQETILGEPVETTLRSVVRDADRVGAPLGTMTALVYAFDAPEPLGGFLGTGRPAEPKDFALLAIVVGHPVRRTWAATMKALCKAASLARSRRGAPARERAIYEKVVRPMEMIERAVDPPALRFLRRLDADE